MTPPSDNMGVTNPELHPTHTTTCSLDWLQYSIPWPAGIATMPQGGPALINVLKSALPPSDAITVTGELLHGGRGYTDGMQSTHARLFWHRLNRMQHIGVLMTGEDLRAVLTIPFPHDALVRWCVAKAKKIARLDFALDVFDPQANPTDVLHMWKRGDVGTPARYVELRSSYTSTREGGVIEAPTVYVGAPDSDRRIRVYDKAKEKGVPGPWTRIEIQMRDARAWSLARSCATYGIERAGLTAIRDFVTIKSLGWWSRATTGTPVYIEPVGRAETNTDKWLREVCLPAIEKRAKEQIALGSWALYDAVERTLADVLRQTDVRRSK